MSSKPEKPDYLSASLTTSLKSQTASDGMVIPDYPNTAQVNNWLPVKPCTGTHVQDCGCAHPTTLRDTRALSGKKRPRDIGRIHQPRSSSEQRQSQYDKAHKWVPVPVQNNKCSCSTGCCTSEQQAETTSTSAQGTIGPRARGHTHQHEHAAVSTRRYARVRVCLCRDTVPKPTLPASLGTVPEKWHATEVQ